MLALTFDDGPDPRGTAEVLDALAQAGVKATFFVLGGRVEEHPELLERTVEEGHAVEVHGFEHLRHPNSTREAVARDLDRALDALARHGIVPERWRIPWGHLAEFSVQIARARQLEVVGWDADTHDWRGDDARTMLEQLELRHGGIVLAHDGISVGARRDDGAKRRRSWCRCWSSGRGRRDSNRGRSRRIGRLRSRSGIRTSIPG